MTKNLLLKPFADGVEINEVDLMKCRHVLYLGPQFGKLLRRKGTRSGDGDINVGMGASRTVGPRTKPNDLYMI